MFYKINNYIVLSLSESRMKRVIDLHNVSERFNAKILNNLQLYELTEYLAQNFII
jgi:hypothetical protein